MIEPPIRVINRMGRLLISLFSVTHRGETVYFPNITSTDSCSTALGTPRPAATGGRRAPANDRGGSVAGRRPYDRSPT